MTKEYQELVEDRIFIGGAAGAKAAAEAEKIDVVVDLRAEAAEGDYDYVRVHSPIMDDSDGQQDESIKKAIYQVIDAYPIMRARKFIFTVRVEATGPVL